MLVDFYFILILCPNSKNSGRKNDTKGLECYILSKLKANTMHSLQNVDYYRIILTLYCTYGFFNIKSINYYMLINYKRALFLYIRTKKPINFVTRSNFLLLNL